jgi:hypothetical protein
MLPGCPGCIVNVSSMLWPAWIAGASGSLLPGVLWQFWLAGTSASLLPCMVWQAWLAGTSGILLSCMFWQPWLTGASASLLPCMVWQARLAGTSGILFSCLFWQAWLTGASGSLLPWIVRQPWLTSGSGSLLPCLLWPTSPTEQLPLPATFGSNNLKSCVKKQSRPARNNLKRHQVDDCLFWQLIKVLHMLTKSLFPADLLWLLEVDASLVVFLNES